MFHDTQTTIARARRRCATWASGSPSTTSGPATRRSATCAGSAVDILKIAREFVAPAATGPDGWAFAHAIVALGRTLGLRIVAEGIEEPDQLEQLRELGCEFGQGFLFARPMPGEEMAERHPAARLVARGVTPAARRAAARRRPSAAA